MKRVMDLGLIASGLLFAVACTPVVEDTLDASTSRVDAGSFDSALPDTNVDPVWNVDNYGMACSGDSDCPAGACIDLFQGQGQAACFKVCGSVADCSDFPYNAGAVQCTALSEGGPQVCIQGSGQNGPCGNVLNATCTVQEYGLCGTDTSGAGTCVRGCNPADPTAATCTTLPAANCGCLNGDHCSTTLMAFGTAEDPDGICAPATSAGDTCGYDVSTLNVLPCTDDQVCDGISQSNPTGTCAVESADAGVAEDAN